MPVVLALSHAAVNAGSNRIIPSILIAGIRSDFAILYKVFGLISSRKARSSAVQAVLLAPILLAKSGWSLRGGITNRLPPPGTGEYPPKPLVPFNSRYYHYSSVPLSGLSLSVFRIGMDSPVECVHSRI